MKKIWVFLLVTILFSGCARQAPKVWTEVPTADSLISRINISRQSFRNLDTEAKVSLTTRGKYFTTHQFLLAERPDRLRADVLTGFGQLVMQMATDGDSMAVFLNNTVPGRFYSGAATQENFSRFVRIPLEVRDLVSLLLYAPPLIPWQNATVTAREDSLLLALHNGAQRQEVVFDEQLRVSVCRYYRGTSLNLMVEYDDFTDGQAFPRKLKINVPHELTEVYVSMKQPSLNNPIDNGRFTLTAPDGVPEERL